jgi:hypothetical protein
MRFGVDLLLDGVTAGRQFIFDTYIRCNNPRVVRSKPKSPQAVRNNPTQAKKRLEWARIFLGWGAGSFAPRQDDTVSFSSNLP